MQEKIINNRDLSKKKLFLIISGLIIVSLLVGGAFIIGKNTQNSLPDKPVKEKKDKRQPNQPNNLSDNDNPPLPPTPNYNEANFVALAPTKNELEYKNNPPLSISSVGTDYSQLGKINKNNLLPGSALLTDTLDGSGSGSSILNSKGITHIIHATPWPRVLFENDNDFINCVVKSVQNSIILADRYKFEKLAIPLVGGGFYLNSCDPQKLAEGIIRGAVNQLEKCQNLKNVIFLDWHNDQTPHKNRQVFLTAFGKLEDEGGWVYKHRDGGVELAKNPTKLIFFDWGDIRDKNFHGASVIVNAANTQVRFGGGISGAIAEQVGDKTKIEQKSQELIAKFNNKR